MEHPCLKDRQGLLVRLNSKTKPTDLSPSTKNVLVLGSNQDKESLIYGAVVVAQLVERLLSTPEIRSSNPVIGKILSTNFTIKIQKRQK